MKRIIKKIFYRVKWADNHVIVAVFKMFYLNIFRLNRFVIFEWDLREDIDTIGGGKKDYEIKILSSKELNKYLEGKKSLPRDFYMDVIGGLRHCVVAIKDNEIIHICWIYMAGDKNRFLDIKPDEAHLDYAFTFPQYRGLGLNIESHLAAARWLKDRNIRRIVVGVHENTKYMLNSLGKIKHVKRVGTLSHWFVYRPKFKG